MNKEIQAILTILENSASSGSIEGIKEGLQNAISKLKSEAQKEAKQEEIKEEKKIDKAIPYSIHGDISIAQEDTEWDAGKEVMKASGNGDALMKMHTYVNSEDESFNKDERQFYKLPHHKGNGNQAVIWNGVSAAMGALLGARGGVDIPEADRQAVYNHLKSHYEQFNKTVPKLDATSSDFKDIKREIENVLSMQDKDEMISSLMNILNNINAVNSMPVTDYDIAEDVLGLGEDKTINYQIEPLDFGDNSEIDGNRFRKQVLKFGKFIHMDARGGVLNITKEAIKKIVKNFKDGVIDNIFVPLGHTTDLKRNTGKVVDLIATKDGLDAIIEIRDKSTQKKITDKLIEKTSVSIDENYLNKESGKYVGPVLRHIALVAEPYIKGMGDFVQLSEDEDRKVVMLTEETTIDEDITQICKMFEKAIKLIIDKTKKGEKVMDKKDEKDIKNVNEKVEEKATNENVNEEVKEKEEKKEDEITNDSKQSEEETKSDESDSDATEDKEKSDDSKNEPSTEDENEGQEASKEDESPENEPEVDDVDLEEAEREYDKLLRNGKVLPVQKDEVVSLLASRATINLSDGEKSVSELIKSLLSKQPKVLDFEEKGTNESDKKDEKSEQDTNKENEAKAMFSKIGLSDEDIPDALKELEKLDSSDEL